MTYEEIFGRLEGQTVVEVAEAKGGGLAILFDDGPTILIVGGDNETMCVQGVEAWEDLWRRVRV
jgi:hypothetical protein